MEYFPNWFLLSSEMLEMPRTHPTPNPCKMSAISPNPLAATLFKAVLLCFISVDSYVVGSQGKSSLGSSLHLGHFPTEDNLKSKRLSV